MAKKIKNLLEGNISKQLNELALPAIWGTASVIIYQFSDSYFLGLYNNNDLAAATFCYPLFSIIISFFIGVGIGSTIILSPIIGENDFQEFKKQFLQIFSFSLFIGIILISLLIFYSNNILILMNVPKSIKNLSDIYLKINYFGILFLFSSLLFNSSFKSLGLTNIIAKGMLLSSTINFILDPILIFGVKHIIPPMGIKGAGIASLTGWFLNFFLSIYYVKKHHVISFSINFKNNYFHNIKHWLYLSIPSSLGQLLSPMTNMVIVFFITSFGANALSGFGLANRFEKMALVFSFAFSNAIMIFSGQNFGAKNFERIIKAISILRKKTFIFSFFIISTTLILLPYAHNITNLNSKSQSIFNTYISILFFTIFFQALSNICMGSINGLKKPKITLMLNLTKIFLLLIPMIYFGKMMYGLKGIFLGIALTHFIYFILIIILLNKIIKKENYSITPTDPELSDIK